MLISTGSLPLLGFALAIRVKISWSSLVHFITRGTNLCLTSSRAPSCSARFVKDRLQQIFSPFKGPPDRVPLANESNLRSSKINLHHYFELTVPCRHVHRVPWTCQGRSEEVYGPPSTLGPSRHTSWPSFKLEHPLDKFSVSHSKLVAVGCLHFPQYLVWSMGRRFSPQ